MIDQQEKRRATADAILSTRVREGIEQGREEGIEQGLEQGLEQGIEQGRIELILEMLKNGAGLDFVSAVTKQPKDEIEHIASEHDLSVQN